LLTQLDGWIRPDHTGWGISLMKNTKIGDAVTGAIGSYSDGKHIGFLDMPNTDVKLKITSAALEVVTAPTGKQSQMVVLHFSGTPKGLALNRVNSRVISSNLNSTEVKDWIGKSIVLYTTHIACFGQKRVGAVRVRSNQELGQ